MFLSQKYRFSGLVEACSVKSSTFACMKKITFRKIRWTLLAICLLYVWGCRWIPGWGEGYATCLYPTFSAGLSAVSGLFPFSLEEILVVTVVVWLLGYSLYARICYREKVRTIIRREVEVLLALYCWFYLGWGNNYYRQDFFRRSQTERVEYDEQRFRDFLTMYVDSLNASYLPSVDFSADSLEYEMKVLYAQVPSRFGLSVPRDWQHPKRVLFNSLYSGVGVLGYMGPFFAESQLNAELLPIQYPFTYIHEYAHLLGVSNEAEANFWAYQICVRSVSPAVRYSGYFGLLPYVAVNAASVLSESDYRDFLDTIRPEVLGQWKEKSKYWEERYSPLVGAVQRKMYDWFLKGNKISEGHKNYAQVVEMILALPADWWKVKR